MEPVTSPTASSSRYRRRIEALLELADIRVNGGRPFDMAVRDDAVFGMVLAGGSLALGESYMAGMWDCDRLDEFFYRILSAELDRKVRNPRMVFDALTARLLNVQKPSRAFAIGRRHYDKGNDLFRAMLDSRMIYSCGYWKDAATLDEAQRAKLDLVCRKLGLRPGMRVLDIGCGWGGTAKFIAEEYGCSVVGITVSEQQARFATELCRGVPVEIRLQDYRDLDERFDRVLSIGMFEHVGYKNYRTFMHVVRKVLAEDGLSLLHTIGASRSGRHGDPWVEKYIFPNSMLPSAAQITAAYEGLFVLEDWHSFGQHYDRTLLSWYANFTAAWEKLQASYDERFRRMWAYYLLSSAGSFRARKNQVWQLVLSPRGVVGGYEALRWDTTGKVAGPRG